MQSTSPPVRLPSTPSRRGHGGWLTAVAAAAAAAVLASASAARAQFRTGADGHANDANSRIGSGGYNSPNDASYRSALGTQVLTGNSTGLSYFHSGSGTFDANNLQLNTEDRAFQAFTRTSAPVNYAQQSNGTPNYTSYYNQQQYAGQIPPALQSTRNGVGLIPAPQVNPLTPSSDTSLQKFNNLSPVDQGNALPTPGALDQPGPVNPVGNQSLYQMSPLYGLRQLQQNDPAQGNAFISNYGPNGRLGSGPRLDNQSVQQLRNELNTTSTSDQVDGGSVPNVPGGSPLSNGGTGSASASSALTGQVGGQRVTGNAVPNAAAQPNALSGAVGSARVENAGSGTLGMFGTEGMAPVPGRPPLAPAAAQSKQIADLQQRFNRLSPSATIAQRLNAGQQQPQRKPKSAGHGETGPFAAKGKPGSAASGLGVKGGLEGGSTTTTQQPGLPAVVPPMAGQSVPPAVPEPTGVSNEPLVISSLSTGIRAKGLRDLLHSAEDQMRAGKFSQAVDTYETAGAVAPNNPFVPLGRSFAELGASYYGRAELDLTRAVTTEPAVLAGQYDLKGFLGVDRLKFVESDLANIAATDHTARPHLLLAYLFHNAGRDDATEVAPQLDQAEALAGDAKLIGLMRDAWGIKPGSMMNK